MYHYHLCGGGGKLACFHIEKKIAAPGSPIGLSIKLKEKIKVILTFIMYLLKNINDRLMVKVLRKGPNKIRTALQTVRDSFPSYGFPK